MESGSAPAAIRLAAESRGFPGTGPTRLRIRCTHPGHLTYCAATVSTTSRYLDHDRSTIYTAAPARTTPTPGFALAYVVLGLLAVCLYVLVTILGLVSVLT